MQQEVITARGLYSLLASGAETEGGHRSFISPVTAYTQSRFWGNFLAECATDAVVNQYFITTEKRPRALSSLMNRSCTHSMPLRLYKALEESLDGENMVCQTVWVAAALEQSVNPMAIHAALTEYEDRMLRTDPWLERVGAFFIRIRPAVQRGGTYHLKKLFLQAAYRITMLGLHALYGDRMLDSEALKRLRMSHLCDIDILWKQAVSISPRINSQDFSHVKAAARRLAAEPPAAEPGAHGGDLAPVLKRFEASLPEAEQLACADPATCGWYVVSNWLDNLVSVNDQPLPTYDGAEQLTEVTNGTIVYVLSAPGYKGLHVSKNVWGRIIWNGRTAWIPMNLLVKLSL